MPCQVFSITNCDINQTYATGYVFRLDNKYAILYLPTNQTHFCPLFLYLDQGNEIPGYSVRSRGLELHLGFRVWLQVARVYCDPRRTGCTRTRFNCNTLKVHSTRIF